MILKPDSSLHPNRRPRIGFGRASGFFGRWIGCQGPFPKVRQDDGSFPANEPIIA
jgi:hypothetical protein